MAANVKPLRVAMHCTVLAVHRWTGLTVGLVLAFMAATGIFLSYRSRMEPLVYRDPKGSEYETCFTLHRGESISPLAFPGVTFKVEDLLG